MILWLIFALMTLAAIAAVWWPLARRQKSVRSGSDIAVYRDQLEEIDRVYLAYPELNDDDFVRDGRDAWLKA